MRAAILNEYGEVPQPGETAEPAEAGEGQMVVDVLAAGLNPVDISIASGTFYAGAPPLPYVVGKEGVGRTSDGQRVYFDAPVAPSGSFAERAVIESESTVALPDGLDDALAVSLGIAGLAAWLALEWRAQLREGETVLVLGASGVVGQIGVQAARLLGAGRVVAAARSPEGLERARRLGADATVRLDRDEKLAEAFREAAGGAIDVVLDPVWGAPAAAAIDALAVRGRLVQIGQSAGATAEIASAPVRGRLAAILGHMNFLVPLADRQAAYARMARHAAAGELTVEVERVALEDVEQAWKRQQDGPGRKLAIVP